MHNFRWNLAIEPSSSSQRNVQITSNSHRSVHFKKEKQISAANIIYTYIKPEPGNKISSTVTRKYYWWANIYLGRLIYANYIRVCWFGSSLECRPAELQLLMYITRVPHITLLTSQSSHLIEKLINSNPTKTRTDPISKFWYFYEVICSTQDTPEIRGGDQVISILKSSD